MLTAPMNTGRCMAFRDRAVIQTVRGIIERYSAVNIGMRVSWSVSSARKRGGSFHQGRGRATSARRALDELRGGSRMASTPFTSHDARVLLNRDLALHAHREVRCAVNVVRAGLDVRERDGVGLVRIAHEGPGEGTHVRAGHVRIELCLRVGGHRRIVERDVVWATRDVDELDRVTRLHSDVRRLETISFVVAEHFYF